MSMAVKTARADQAQATRHALIDAARAQIDEMCARLLTNPVLEDYSVEVAPAAAEGAA